MRCCSFVLPRVRVCFPPLSCAKRIAEAVNTLARLVPFTHRVRLNFSQIDTPHELNECSDSGVHRILLMSSSQLI
jgi:hypothetical protein